LESPAHPVNAVLCLVVLLVRVLAISLVMRLALLLVVP
jgi:hypothetical protein